MSSASLPPQLPRAPGAWPFLGHAPPLVRDPARWLAACRAAGDVVRVDVGPRRLHLVCAPQLVGEVLVGRAESFDKGGPLFETAREYVGNGLVTARHVDQRRQRRLMQPAFSTAQITAYAEAMQEKSGALAAAWRPGQEIAVLDAMHGLAAGVLGRVLFPAADLPDGQRLAAQIKTLVDGTAVRSVFPFVDRLPLPSNRRFDEACRQMRALAGRTIEASRSGTDRGRLMTALLGTDADGDVFSDAELQDQVATLLLAGGETTATTLAWVFHLLARHPEVERRLLQELETVLEGRPARQEDFRHLPVTRNILLETMRLYPVVWILSRVAAEDVELGGHRFAAGTDFLFSAYQLHHDPAVFPRPDTFDPDRWNAPPTPATRQAYLPFLAGRRRCIGDTFALAEMTIALSVIVPRWKLRPAPGRAPARPRFSALLTPRDLVMVATPRRRAHG